MSESKDSQLILFSDPHFFHSNIMLYSARTKFMTEKDFAAYEEYLETKERFKPRMSEESIHNMNMGIISNINSTVKDPDKDVVVCVGDWCFGSAGKNASVHSQYYKNAEWARSQINCKDVRLVFGNHDHRNVLSQLFTRCYDQTFLSINKKRVWLSHYPMICWDGSNRGVPLAYGHVHGLYHNISPHPLRRPDLWAAVDVGVDTNDYKPYTIDTIMEIVKPVFDKQYSAYKTGQHRHSW